MLVHVNVHVPKNFFSLCIKYRISDRCCTFEVGMPNYFKKQHKYASTKMRKLTINGLLFFGLVDKYHNSYQK